MHTPPLRPPLPPQGFASFQQTAVHAADKAAVQKARLITAVKTPYLPNGEFDIEAYDGLVEMQIKHGVEVRRARGGRGYSRGVGTSPVLGLGIFALSRFPTLAPRNPLLPPQGVIVGGTTGEGHLMSWDEHIM